MKFSYNIIKSMLVLFLILNINNRAFAEGGESETTNNAFVFNGLTSQLYVYDGQPANYNANQNGFKFFNRSTSNKKISVQVKIYLLGDTPTDVEVPIIYRKVNNGNTFSIYVKNNKGYFSVGNNNTATVSTTEFPAYQWITLRGTFNGSKLKIYQDGSLISSNNFSMTSGYNITNGVTGLFIGKSDAGALKGFIDQIEIYTDDDEPDSDGDDGNTKYGYWAFTEISSGNVLVDQSSKKNNLNINDITEVVQTDHLPFFVVNSTSDEGDANPGDGKAVSSNGNSTLRSVIEESNLIPGQHLVYFYIKNSSPVIQPLTALPAIVQSIVLDGTTQPGYSGSPIISINGDFGGLTINAGSSSIQGLSLNSTSGYGLTLSTLGGNNISSNQISGILISSPENNINKNSITGSAVNGISIIAGGINNHIGNVNTNNIFNNSGYGISITDAIGNQFKNNIIETNSQGGIYVSNSSGIFTRK